MRSFFSLMNRFRRDRRGNIAVIFAVATVPLISAIGCAIDYSEAARIKAKLQSAADAAAVASISQRSQGWLAASTMTTNGPVPVAETDATNIFNGNINATVNQLFTLNTAGTNAVVTKTGATLTATVNFSADVPVTFMKVAGFTKLTVSGVSDSERHDAAVSRFLSGAGRIGVDGTAVDIDPQRRRSQAVAGYQPG